MFPTSVIANVMQRSFEVPVLLFDARVTMEIRITNVITMDAGQENNLSSSCLCLLLLLLMMMMLFEYLNKRALAIRHIWPFACSLALSTAIPSLPTLTAMGLKDETVSVLCFPEVSL